MGERFNGINGHPVVQMLGLTVIFILYHFAVVYGMTHWGLDLGAVEPDAAPLYAKPVTQWGKAIVPAALLYGLLLAGLAVALRRKLRDAVLLPVLMGLMGAIAVAVAMIDGGLWGLISPLTRSWAQYIADVPKVDGARSFLQSYAQIFNTLTDHARTHPPGSVLALWVIGKVFGYTLVRTALGMVAAGCLNLIPIYYLGKVLVSRRVGLLAAGLYILTPNVILFTATSLDGLSSFFPALGLLFFVLSYKKNSLVHAALGGLSLGAGMLINYSTVIIGVFLILLSGLRVLGAPAQWRRCLVRLGVMGMVFAAFYGILYAWSGYHPIEAFLLAYKKDEMTMGTGYADFGSYLHLSLANGFAYLMGIGVPLATLWLRSSVVEVKRIFQSEKAVDAFALAGFLTFLFFCFSTLFTLEVERIFIIMAPFVVIPVARLMDEHFSARFYLWTGAALAVQTLLFEVFLYTYY